MVLSVFVSCLIAAGGWEAPPLVSAEGQPLLAPAAPPPPLPHAPAGAPLAAPADEVSVSAAAPPPAAPPAPGMPLLGLALEVGLPDGVAVTGMVMPAGWLRLQVSGLANGVSSGVRVGAVLLVPWRFLRPLLGVEGGLYLGGNAAWLVPGASEAIRQTLTDVAYAFASAQVGLELGPPGFSLVLRAGLSYLDGSLGNPTVDVAGGTLSATGLVLRGVIPSARVGLMVCFL